MVQPHGNMGLRNVFFYFPKDLQAHSNILSQTQNKDIPKDLLRNASWGRGARLPLRVHLCICMFLHRGKFCS